ncbi:MAG: hypothetical protein LBK44_00425 [Spirochaetales bacterium]|jgi:hypothetical protein|nr:hypothetical protein [Spirochaetales bacterium]
MGLFAYYDLITDLVIFFNHYATGKKNCGINVSSSNSITINPNIMVKSDITVNSTSTTGYSITIIDAANNPVQLVEITDKTELLKVDKAVMDSPLLCVSCPDGSAPVTLWVYRFSFGGTDFIECGKYFICTLNGKELRFWIGVQLVDQEDNTVFYIWIDKKEGDEHAIKKKIAEAEQDGYEDFWIPLESKKIINGIQRFIERLTK